MTKNILLIGGSRGIGLSIVNQLKDTHKIFIASRSQGELDTANVTRVEFDATTDDAS